MSANFAIYLLGQQTEQHPKTLPELESEKTALESKIIDLARQLKVEGQDKSKKNEIMGTLVGDLAILGDLTKRISEFAQSNL